MNKSRLAMCALCMSPVCESFAVSTQRNPTRQEIQDSATYGLSFSVVYHVVCAFLSYRVARAVYNNSNVKKGKTVASNAKKPQKKVAHAKRSAKALIVLEGVIAGSSVLFGLLFHPMFFLAAIPTTLGARARYKFLNDRDLSFVDTASMYYSSFNYIAVGSSTFLSLISLGQQGIKIT